ncbi:MAG: hypothetical protein VX589_02950, partial [Myxococcota bacterium]|nr:hypothetical protein [Myxococcota bacterium]
SVQHFNRWFRPKLDIARGEADDKLALAPSWQIESTMVVDGAARGRRDLAGAVIGDFDSIFAIYVGLAETGSFANPLTLFELDGWRR